MKIARSAYLSVIQSRDLWGLPKTEATMYAIGVSTDFFDVESTAGAFDETKFARIDSIIEVDINTAFA